MTKPSLVRRIRRAMWAYGFGLGVLFFVGILGVSHLTEDLLIARMVEVRLTRAVAGNPRAHSIVHLYTERDVPKPWKERILSLHEGQYELSFPDDAEVFVAVGRRKDGTRVFAVVDSAVLEPSERGFGDALFALSSLVGLGLLVSALLFGAWAARRLTEPLRRLSHLVDTSPHEDLAEELRHVSVEEEVVPLLSSLASSFETLQAYREREQRFTHYASHELRTPVTVIKGAHQILKLKHPDSEKVLGRIDRAVASMDALIETFLWLARSDAPPTVCAVKVSSVVERVLEGALIHSGLGVELTTQIEPETSVYAPFSAVEIVIRNLVANAITASPEGSIVIDANTQRLRIEDTGPGLDDKEVARKLQEFESGSGGHGLGLPIVTRICERLGWQFNLVGTKEGARAEIRWNRAVLD